MRLQDLTAAIKAVLTAKAFPLLPGGLPPVWLGQHHASPERQYRRTLVRTMGHRQALKFIKAARRKART